MSGNKLKASACIAMVVDHVGVLLFPGVAVLRYIGRLSMPIFAYLIAEGCQHTRSNGKYFLKMFGLAAFCQAVYFASDLLSGGIRDIYLNVLFTFSLSILVCWSYLNLKEALDQTKRSRVLCAALLFAGALLLGLFCTEFLDELFGIPTRLDYGFAGIILPLFAVIFPEKKHQLPLFAVGTVIFCLLLRVRIPYIWFSLLSIPLILFYDGTRGTRRLKYAFYLFYPLHFALLYAIKLIAF